MNKWILTCVQCNSEYGFTQDDLKNFTNGKKFTCEGCLIREILSKKPIPEDQLMCIVNKAIRNNDGLWYVYDDQIKKVHDEIQSEIRKIEWNHL